MGGSPWVPKSSLVSTIPRPKISCQNRFTVTRAVSGLFSSASQAASPSRLGIWFSGRGLSAAGTPANTLSPLLRKLPRIRTHV